MTRSVIMDVRSRVTHSRLRQRMGLTLIETLIVIAIVAVARGMVLTAFWYAIKTVRSFHG